MPKTRTQRNRTPRDDPAQSRLFIEKAHEIGADEDKSAADELMGHLHEKPPAHRNQPVNTKSRR
ncbi:MAG: hypothetical protein ABSC37_01490 [Xanthobacteraceae bacterium]